MANITTKTVMRLIQGLVIIALGLGWVLPGLGAAPGGRVGLGGGKSAAKKAAVKLPSLANGVGAVAAPHGAAPSH